MTLYKYSLTFQVCTASNPKVMASAEYKDATGWAYEGWSYSGKVRNEAGVYKNSGSVYAMHHFKYKIIGIPYKERKPCVHGLITYPIEAVPGNVRSCSVKW